MRMFGERIDAETPELDDEGVRMRFIGRREGVAPELVERMDWAEETTAGNERITLFVAFNYGGRAEIVDAARSFEGGSEEEFAPPPLRARDARPRPADHAPAASSGSPTTCSGSAPTRSSSSATSSGRTSAARPSSSRCRVRGPPAPLRGEDLTWRRATRERAGGAEGRRGRRPRRRREPNLRRAEETFSGAEPRSRPRGGSSAARSCSEERGGGRGAARALRRGPPAPGRAAAAAAPGRGDRCGGSSSRSPGSSSRSRSPSPAASSSRSRWSALGLRRPARVLRDDRALRPIQLAAYIAAAGDDRRRPLRHRLQRSARARRLLPAALRLRRRTAATATGSRSRWASRCSGSSGSASRSSTRCCCATCPPTARRC